MAAANVAHKGENFGDEDDMIFVTMEYDDNRFAVLEWGSAFRWGEHYVLIQGEKGAIKLDMYNTKGTLRMGGKDTYSLFTKPKKKMMTVPVFTTAQKWTVRFNTVNRVNAHR